MLCSPGARTPLSVLWEHWSLKLPHDSQDKSDTMGMPALSQCGCEGLAPHCCSCHLHLCESLWQNQSWAESPGQWSLKTWPAHLRGVEKSLIAWQAGTGLICLCSPILLHRCVSLRPLLVKLLYFICPLPCASSKVPPLFLFGMPKTPWSSAQ